MFVATGSAVGAMGAGIGKEVGSTNVPTNSAISQGRVRNLEIDRPVLRLGDRDVRLAGVVLGVANPRL